MINGNIIEQDSTKCCLSIYLDPFGQKRGNAWFHAAIGKPGFRGISLFLVLFKMKKEKRFIYFVCNNKKAKLIPL